MDRDVIVSAIASNEIFLSKASGRDYVDCELHTSLLKKILDAINNFDYNEEKKARDMLDSWIKVKKVCPR